MTENGTAFDNGGGDVYEAGLTEVDRDPQDTQPVVSGDPIVAMQSALASFDGIRVDATIQVILRDFPRTRRRSTLWQGQSTQTSALPPSPKCPSPNVTWDTVRRTQSISK